MKLAVVLWFCASLAVAQRALPDAPSTSKPKLSNGTLVLGPPTFPAQLGQYVDRITVDSITDKPRHFYQPATSFKAIFKSKSFWLSEGAAWGAAIADARINNCGGKGTYPCGKEMYLDALSPMFAVTPLHILTARGISPLLGIGSCAYVIFRHGRGAVTGVYP